jgi:hypothetical protein
VFDISLPSKVFESCLLLREWNGGILRVFAAPQKSPPQTAGVDATPIFSTRTNIMRWAHGRVAADKISTLPSCELARRSQVQSFSPVAKMAVNGKAHKVSTVQGGGHQHVAPAKTSRCPLPRCSTKLLDVACTLHLAPHYLLVQ